MPEDCFAARSTLTDAAIVINTRARLPVWCATCQTTYQWDKT